MKGGAEGWKDKAKPEKRKQHKKTKHDGGLYAYLYSTTDHATIVWCLSMLTHQRHQLAPLLLHGYRVCPCRDSVREFSCTVSCLTTTNCSHSTAPYHVDDDVARKPQQPCFGTRIHCDEDFLRNFIRGPNKKVRSSTHNNIMLFGFIEVASGVAL